MELRYLQMLRRDGRPFLRAENSIRFISQPILDNISRSTWRAIDRCARLRQPGDPIRVQPRIRAVLGGTRMRFVS